MTQVRRNEGSWDAAHPLQRMLSAQHQVVHAHVTLVLANAVYVLTPSSKWIAVMHAMVLNATELTHHAIAEVNNRNIEGGSDVAHLLQRLLVSHHRVVNVYVNSVLADAVHVLVTSSKRIGVMHATDLDATELIHNAFC